LPFFRLSFGFSFVLSDYLLYPLAPVNKKIQTGEKLFYDILTDRQSTLYTTPSAKAK